MYEDIQKQGAKAAMHGASKLDCPYLRLNLLPARSAEPIGQWLAKVLAWEAGWNRQQCARTRVMQAGQAREGCVYSPFPLGAGSVPSCPSLAPRDGCAACRSSACKRAALAWHKVR